MSIIDPWLLLPQVLLLVVIVFLAGVVVGFAWGMKNQIAKYQVLNGKLASLLADYRSLKGEMADLEGRIR